MAYQPPPPGATELGQPTPKDVPKQSVEIKELPPEVRRNFLMAMVFFPSLVGAGICAVLFLGWYLLRDNKTPGQYVDQLRAGVSDGTRRSRWQIARELGEHINDPKLHTPEVLTALLEIVENPALDEEVETWSPSTMIRKPDERRTRLRWFAAYYAGHLSGRLQDPRGTAALIAALDEQNSADPASAAGMRYFAAAGLGLIKDPAAFAPLLKHLEIDPDPGVRAIAAKSIGAIAEHRYYREGTLAQADDQLEAVRAGLRTAFQKDGDLDVSYNTAIALARIRDETGRTALQELAKSEDPLHQRMAKQALELLPSGTSK